MKKAFWGLAIMSAGLLSSCSFSSELASNKNLNQTDVVLSQANYKVIGQIKGTSKQNYVLGCIGGMSKKSLNESALSNMYDNTDLKEGSRAVVNINIQQKTMGYVLWAKRKAIATGTLIEFTK